MKTSGHKRKASNGDEELRSEDTAKSTEGFEDMRARVEDRVGDERQDKQQG